MKKVYFIAFFAALLAGCATYFFAQTLLDNTTISVKDSPQTPVYLAKEDVPIGTKIDSDTIDAFFVKQNVATDYVVNGAVTDMEVVMGKLSTRVIYKGDQVSDHDFVDEATSTVGLSYTLEKGNVGYSIQAESVKGVDGYIRVGDTVDLLVKYKGETDPETGEEIAGTAEYDYAFQGLKVVKIGSNSDMATAENGNVLAYQSITLEVDKDTGKALFEMEDASSGGFKFVLNHRELETAEESDSAK